MFRQLRPELLFAPYWVDAHPDHVAAVELIEAARFWSKLTKTDLPGEPHHPARILYYYCVHLRVVEKPAFVLDISRLLAAEASGHRVLSEPVRHRPAHRAARPSSTACAIRPHTGAGRSAWLTASHSPAARPSGWPACAIFARSFCVASHRSASSRRRTDPVVRARDLWRERCRASTAVATDVRKILASAACSRLSRAPVVSPIASRPYSASLASRLSACNPPLASGGLNAVRVAPDKRR